MMKMFHAKTQRRKALRLCILCVFAKMLLFSTVFAQAPDTERAQLRNYIETGRYTEAEATAKKFLLKAPDKGPVRHELAEVLAITGRYTEAITEFERAAADSAKANDIASKLD